MIHTESLFDPIMTAALQEQSARALIVKCQTIQTELNRINLHKNPVRGAALLEELVAATRTAQAAVVHVCRDQYRTWDDIAAATGLTRQGAMHRWGQ